MSGHILNYLQGFQLGLPYQPSRQVLDKLLVEPLQCTIDDDYLGILPRPETLSSNDESPTYALKFCAVDGYTNVLGIANEDGSIAFQDTDKVSPKTGLTGFAAHNNAIFDFCWRQDSAAQLVTVSGDQTVVLWDLANGGFDEVKRYLGHRRSVKCTEWRPHTNSQFATAGRDNSILLWDTRYSSQLKPENAIRNAHPHANSTPRGRRAPSSSGVSCSITALAWINEHNLVSTGDSDGLIKVWDLRKNYCTYRRDPQACLEVQHPGSSCNQGFTSVQVDPSRCFVYVACLDSNVYKFDIVTGEQRPYATYTGASIKNFFVRLSLSACGRYLACGSKDNEVSVWAAASPGDKVAVLGPHESEVTCVSWRRDRWLLASATDDMRHRIWKLGRETDRLLLRGVAQMTHKKDSPRVHTPRSPVKRRPGLVTPTSGRRGGATPQRRGSLRAGGSTSQGGRTPSIAAFFSPAADTKTTPVNTRKSRSLAHRPASLKRRLSMLEGNEENEERQDAAAASVSESIGEILESPSKKCTFTPETYRSPHKRPPVYLGSPLREFQPNTVQLCSPTADLPNLVRDETTAGKVTRVTRHRKADWLTTYSRQKKEGAAAGAPAVKEPTPRRKRTKLS